MSKENILKDKSMKFAIRIVNLYKYLTEQKKEYILSKQVLRSGTSIGANLAESETAISNKDFLAKVYIALKECTETLYWIELLYHTEYITELEYNSLFGDCNELKKLMMATTKTLAAKIKEK